MPAQEHPARRAAPFRARPERPTGRPSADLLARLREVERHLEHPALPPEALSGLRAERAALRLLLRDRRSRTWR